MDELCNKCCVQTPSRDSELCDDCKKRGDDYIVTYDPHNMLLIYYDTKKRPKIPEYTDIKLCITCRKARACVDSGFCRNCPPYTLCNKCGIHRPNQGKAWCELCWKDSLSPLCSCCYNNKPTHGHAWCQQCYLNPPSHMIDASLPHNWPARAISHMIILEEKLDSTMDDGQGQETKKSFLRLFFTSDTHTEHVEIFNNLIKPILQEDGDNMLIHTGDWSQMGDPEHTEDFCKWLEEIHKEGYFKHIVIVCGNHERACGANLSHDKIKARLEKITSVIYLTFDVVIFKEYGNLTILGLSWWDHSDIIPIFNDFKSLPSKLFTIDSKYDRSDVDKIDHINIMISHHPPFGILDEWRGSNKGSKRIVDYLKVLEEKALRPQLHVFGHVHKLGKKEVKEICGNIVHFNVAQAVAHYDFTY